MKVVLVPTIKVNWDADADQAIAMPSYESTGAAGADLRANLKAKDRENGITLAPSQRALIPTGLSVEIPSGYEMQIRPRSGLAYKHGVTLINAPGTIDSDYRGVVGVLLVNLGHEPFVVRHGERIAQAIVAPVSQAQFALATDLSKTTRGKGGFGSTGRE